MTINRRVKNGAAFLDLHVVGWEHKINTNRLDIAFALRCMLGQLFGSYQIGLRKLGLPRYFVPPRLGFICPWVRVCSRDGIGEYYRRLNRAWRRLIRARRAVARKAQLQEAGLQEISL